MRANNTRQTEAEDLTPKEAAAELRMSIHTLRKDVAAGNIQYILKGLGEKRQHIVFTPEQLAQFKRERAHRREATKWRPRKNGKVVRSGVTTSRSAENSFEELRRLHSLNQSATSTSGLKH